MPDESPNPNWPASTYNGFAGPSVVVETPTVTRAPPARRSSRQPLVIGGIAAALAAGVALGFAAQPRHVSSEQAEATATPLPVELGAPAAAAATVTPASAPLDVRPVQTASRTQAPPRQIELPAASAPPAAEPSQMQLHETVTTPAARPAPPPELDLSRPAPEEAPASEEEVDEPTG